MLIQDYLDICDPVLTFDRFMGEIELEKYLKNIPQHYTGRLRYDPVSMLKTVLFGFMANGYISLRELEDQCKVNLRFMYLMDHQAPSYRTFGYFVNEVLADSIEEIFQDIKEQKWFRIGEILNYQNDNKFDEFVEKFNKSEKEILRQLRRTILEKELINFYLEKEQDLDKALNIFIRINSGGEPLNFSDLIMSIAVANWENNDAREVIHNLVDNIRDKGFLISKDFILKVFLYLYSKDIKFKVTNFSKENAKDFEEKWSNIRNAILEVFDLIKTFGFEDSSLTSKNALIPVMNPEIYLNAMIK